MDAVLYKTGKTKRIPVVISLVQLPVHLSSLSVMSPQFSDEVQRSHRRPNVVPCYVFQVLGVVVSSAVTTH